MKRKRPNIATSCPMIEYNRPRPGRYPNLKVVNVGVGSDLLLDAGAALRKAVGLTSIGQSGEEAGSSARRGRVSCKTGGIGSGVVVTGASGAGTGADIRDGARSTSGSVREFSGANTSSPTCFRRSSITDDKKSGLSCADGSPNFFSGLAWEGA